MQRTLMAPLKHSEARCINNKYNMLREIDYE